ncbi:ABC transporter permease [Brachybacterium sp.]|uniref:ABC transporter permease n=1 Tax=Brachybacterium sp. TaxID=1891286 RepID=UPI002ED1E4B5
MSATGRTLLRVECRKLARAGVVRVATLAVLLLTATTTVGGFLAASHAPGTDIGQKAAGMMAAPGWAGYVGLAGTAIGICSLLAAGIVMAWSMGREFTDGTAVALLTLPARPAAVASAKMAAALVWVLVLAVAETLLVTLGGLALGLPATGAPPAAAAVLVVGVLLGVSALPVMWVATVERGYLAGIGATLGIVVITNLTAGFGLGAVIPWAVPVLWAAPGEAVPTALLALPAGVSVAGALLTRRAWTRLELGDR